MGWDCFQKQKQKGKGEGIFKYCEHKYEMRFKRGEIECWLPCSSNKTDKYYFIVVCWDDIKSVCFPFFCKITKIAL